MKLREASTGEIKPRAGQEKAYVSLHVYVCAPFLKSVDYLALISRRVCMRIMKVNLIMCMYLRIHKNMPTH